MGTVRHCAILLFACAFLYSCENQSDFISLPKKLLSFASGLVKRTESAPAQDTIQPNNAAQTSNATLHLNHDNEELARIAVVARDTLPDFFRHLLRPAEGESNFCLKYPFRADADSSFSMEQVWLTEITFKNGVYYGIIANTPFYIQAMKKGDAVSFSAGDITDWMYTSNGKITGGRSIKYLLERIAEHDLSEEQRAILQMFE